MVSVQPSPVCGNGRCEIGERPGGNSTASLRTGAAADDPFAYPALQCQQQDRQRPDSASGKLRLTTSARLLLKPWKGCVPGADESFITGCHQRLSDHPHNVAPCADRCPCQIAGVFYGDWLHRQRDMHAQPRLCRFAYLDHFGPQTQSCAHLQAVPRTARWPWCPAPYPWDPSQCAGGLRGASAPLPAALACAAGPTRAQTAVPARRGTTARACAAWQLRQVSPCGPHVVGMPGLAAHWRAFLVPGLTHSCSCLLSVNPIMGTSRTSCRIGERQASSSQPQHLLRTPALRVRCRSSRQPGL